jgi:hypothetical protein
MIPAHRIKDISENKIITIPIFPSELKNAMRFIKFLLYQQMLYRFPDTLYVAEDDIIAVCYFPDMTGH